MGKDTQIGITSEAVSRGCWRANTSVTKQKLVLFEKGRLLRLRHGPQTRH